MAEMSLNAPEVSVTPSRPAGAPLPGGAAGTRPPLYIMMTPRDNVAIVANDGGLPAGTVFPSGLTLVDKVPQGAQGRAGRYSRRGRGATLRRRDRLCAEAAGGGQLGPRAAAADAGGARARGPADRHRQVPIPRLRSRAIPSRAIAIPTARSARATSWRSRRPCSAWPASPTMPSSASRPNCCPGSRTSTTSSALDHTYGCGVAIDAPDAIVPIRTLRNISLNPNFGGEVMVVSLGCEKLQPERLMPPGTIPLIDERNVADIGDSADEKLDVVVPAGRAPRRLHVDDRLDHDARPRSTSSG